jgi:hypothetical protein
LHQLGYLSTFVVSHRRLLQRLTAVSIVRRRVERDGASGNHAGHLEVTDGHGGTVCECTAAALRPDCIDSALMSAVLPWGASAAIDDAFVRPRRLLNPPERPLCPGHLGGAAALGGPPPLAAAFPSRPPMTHSPHITAIASTLAMGAARAVMDGDGCQAGCSAVIVGVGELLADDTGRADGDSGPRYASEVPAGARPPWWRPHDGDAAGVIVPAARLPRVVYVPPSPPMLATLIPVHILPASLGIDARTAPSMASPPRTLLASTLRRLGPKGVRALRRWWAARFEAAAPAFIKAIVDWTTARDAPQQPVTAKSSLRSSKLAPSRSFKHSSSSSTGSNSSVASNASSNASSSSSSSSSSSTTTSSSSSSTASDVPVSSGARLQAAMIKSPLGKMASKLQSKMSSSSSTAGASGSGSASQGGDPAEFAASGLNDSSGSIVTVDGSDPVIQVLGATMAEDGAVEVTVRVKGVACVKK